MIDKAIDRECCGCKMCGDLCPTGAIRFVTDHEGFWYPQVDGEKCVKCGLCVKKCPVLNETVNPNAFIPDAYCAWIRDEDMRIKSTSGGAYSALALRMLDDGGYIAGCVFSDDWKSAKHVVGSTRADLEKIFRTKYFQSDTAGIYRAVKELLDQGKQVLFCGSPCQNAALREYLDKEYENLIQCDFICRGINSPAAHRANIRELEKKYGSEVEFFNFKNKSAGWTRLGLLVKFKNGKQDFTDRYTSAWTKGYINYNLFMRPSCEHCHFKRLPRVSDFSIGDFWGLESSPENMEKGMSAVMVNTEKGRRYYERTLPYLHSERQDFETVLKGNGSIQICPKYYPKKRDEFFRNIEKEDFSKLVKRLNWDLALKQGVRRMLSKGKHATLRMLHMEKR